jgi:cell division protein FtsW
VLLNIAVVKNVLINTGITLPFISYGGSSSVFLLIEIGIALSVSRSIRMG